ncbi:hypothetical protein GJ744_008303 [Endocarpon pusillum]|uniref:Uncharacterized protein n=1 Tax=Endocarpon pusillum TaxID=364733 RepID=A0A8H7AHP1_9EURO|nr:hypothetical protein GJ744_008303 [Endocarpon pusillum]
MSDFTGPGIYRIQNSATDTVMDFYTSEKPMAQRSMAGDHNNMNKGSKVNAPTSCGSLPTPVLMSTNTLLLTPPPART